MQLFVKKLVTRKISKTSIAGTYSADPYPENAKPPLLKKEENSTKCPVLNSSTCMCFFGGRRLFMFLHKFYIFIISLSRTKVSQTVSNFKIYPSMMKLLDVTVGA
jgi:hypothetical protein